MPRRCKLLAALLLVAVSSAPELFWVSAHALNPHGHPGEALPNAAAGAALAEVLIHGHDHPRETTPHQHDLAPAPPLRQDPPRHLQGVASPLSFLPAARLVLSSVTLGGHASLRPSGCGPPPPQLLCVLLI